MRKIEGTKGVSPPRQHLAWEQGPARPRPRAAEGWPSKRPSGCPGLELGTWRRSGHHRPCPDPGGLLPATHVCDAHAHILATCICTHTDLTTTHRHTYRPHACSHMYVHTPHAYTYTSHMETGCPIRVLLACLARALAPQRAPPLGHPQPRHQVSPASVSPSLESCMQSGTQPCCVD